MFLKALNEPASVEHNSCMACTVCTLFFCENCGGGQDGVCIECMNKAIRSDNSNYKNVWETCTSCALHCGVPHKVFGTGNRVDPLFLIIGQSPGEQEVDQKAPFVGPVSKHLNDVLRSVHIDREKDCYLTNTVVCRSWIPNLGKNVPPTTGEILACQERLHDEIASFKKKLRCVILVGKEAYMTWILGMKGLTDPKYNPKNVKVGPILGWHNTDSLPAYAVYHPSYIARQGSNELAKAWKQDFEAIVHYVTNSEFIHPRR